MSQSCSSLKTAPPCADAFHPAALPCVAETAEARISRAKKRKFRDRRTAVRKALVNTASLKKYMLQPSSATTDSSGMDVREDQTFTGLLSAILSRLTGIENSMAINSISGYGMCAYSLSSLDPYAQAFVPIDSGIGDDECTKVLDALVAKPVETAALQGDFRAMPPQGWSSIHSKFSVVGSDDAECSNSNSTAFVTSPHPAQVDNSSNEISVKSIEESITRITSSSPSATSAVPLNNLATRRTYMRVQWHEELSADDVLDYFSSYGQIEEFDWLEDGEKSEKSVEEMKLRFAKPASKVEAMRKHKHQIIRESDGKEIQVKVFVKFSDNVVTRDAGQFTC